MLNSGAMYSGRLRSQSLSATANKIRQIVARDPASQDDQDDDCRDIFLQGHRWRGLGPQEPIL